MPVLNITTEADFAEKVLNSTKPVLVDFYTPCVTYTMVEPDLQKVAASYEGKAVVAKLNVDALPTIGASYDIETIPTIIVFKNGRETKRIMGFRDAIDMTKAIDGAM